MPSLSTLYSYYGALPALEQGLTSPATQEASHLTPFSVGRPYYRESSFWWAIGLQIGGLLIGTGLSVWEALCHFPTCEVDQRWGNWLKMLTFGMWFTGWAIYLGVVAPRREQQLNRLRLP